MNHHQNTTIQKNQQLTDIVKQLCSSIPADQRASNQQLLYIFRAGNTFIFEYKAFRSQKGVQKKVLLWLMLREDKLQRLTFKKMSQDQREFVQGILSWNQKSAVWKGEDLFELQTVFKCK